MHVLATFGAHLKELHPILLSNGITLLKRDLALFFEVAFGRHQYLADIFGGIGFNLFDPGDYIIIAAIISDGVSKDNAGRTFVVSLCNVAKALLTSSIPYLQFDLLIINVEHLNLEVNPNGSHITILEHSFAKVSKQVCLTHPTIAHDYHL